jgi:hypothetical protein
MFRIPAIDDEVLVAFSMASHPTLRRGVAVGLRSGSRAQNPTLRTQLTAALAVVVPAIRLDYPCGLRGSIGVSGGISGNRFYRSSSRTG